MDNASRDLKIGFVGESGNNNECEAKNGSWDSASREEKEEEVNAGHASVDDTEPELGNDGGSKNASRKEATRGVGMTESGADDSF